MQVLCVLNFDRIIVVLCSGIKLGTYGASVRRSLMLASSSLSAISTFVLTYIFFLFTDCRMILVLGARVHVLLPGKFKK